MYVYFYLTEKCDRLLCQLLRVANVAENHAIKCKRLVSFELLLGEG